MTERARAPCLGAAFTRGYRVHALEPLRPLGDANYVQGFVRWEGQRTAVGPQQENAMRLMFGLRTTGPFLGADW